MTAIPTWLWWTSQHGHVCPSILRTLAQPNDAQLGTLCKHLYYTIHGLRRCFTRILGLRYCSHSIATYQPPFSCDRRRFVHGSIAPRPHATSMTARPVASLVAGFDMVKFTFAAKTSSALPSFCSSHLALLSIPAIGKASTKLVEPCPLLDPTHPMSSLRSRLDQPIPLKR